ncbi:mitochondrial branched-chain alpha-ketoacid dehydrogenase kinase-domain-containing protein, partial [Thamnocephalis sphaerospora]
QYAAQESKPVSIRKLLQFGKPPLSEASLLRSAQDVWKELPVRMAKRVVAFQRLPFIVGTNPYIREVHQLYYDSFERLRAVPKPRDHGDDEALTDMLLDLTSRHADAIPMLARGFLESNQYMDADIIKDFLDDMIHARVGIRLIAENHIALHHSTPDYIGIIDTRLRPAKLLERCSGFVQELCEINYGSTPEHIIDGQTDVTFQYVPVHLEYIACELLKNAYRATVEQSEHIGRREHPPIQITVSYGNGDIGIRIRDQGGGIPFDRLSHVFEYSYTTVKPDGEDDSDALDNIFSTQTRLAMQTGVGGPMAGLGFGLPMTRIYAEYFGGTLDVMSLPGHGCDVFLRLRSIDDSLNRMEI